MHLPLKHHCYTCVEPEITDLHTLGIPDVSGSMIQKVITSKKKIMKNQEVQEKGEARWKQSNVTKG